MPRRLTFVAMACVSMFAASQAKSDEATAEDKRACISSHEKSQVSRHDGKLKEARELLLTCSRDMCPSVVRKDCSQWLDEVEEALPTVVVEGRGKKGEDVVEMKVYCDDKLLTEKLDGRALAVDPGPHVFRYELAGTKPRQESVLVREGQKNRKLSVDFGPKPTGGTPGSAGAGDSEKDLKRPVPATVYIFGGLGLAALGASAVFGVTGMSKRNDLDSRACKPACPQEDVDAAKRNFLIGDIALGVGVVSLGVATVIYFTRPVAKPKPTKAWAPQFDVMAVGGGAMAGVRTAF